MRSSTRVGTVRAADELAGALEVLGLADPRPVIILIGGADGLGPGVERELEALFTTCLSPLAEELRAAIVDGGTASGVMRMIGEARAAAGHAYALVGVAASGTVGPGGSADTRLAPSDTNHSHLILVPGERWGDEGHWLRAVACAMAADRKLVTLLVNGGPLARREALDSAAAGIPVVIVAGSGRAADALAGQREAAEFAAGPLMSSVDLADLLTLRALLAERLGSQAP